MKVAANRLLTRATIVIFAAVLPWTIVWPEIKYRTALPKYGIGVSAEQIERRYGIHLELRKNGNFLPDGEDEYQKRRHYSYDATFLMTSCTLTSMTFMKSLKSQKQRLLRNSEEVLGSVIPEFPAFCIRGRSPWLLERFIAGVEDAFASLEVDAKF
jgi:hypothetical protein